MTPASTDHQCLWCGGSPIERHHISGKDPDDSYLDADLVVPLCGVCHQLTGSDARAERIETPDPELPWSLLASVEWWLKRAAVFVARSCVFYDTPWLVALAESLRRNADALTVQREILDARYPNWRTAAHPLDPHQGDPS